MGLCVAGRGCKCDCEPVTEFACCRAEERRFVRLVKREQGYRQCPEGGEADEQAAGQVGSR